MKKTYTRSCRQGVKLGRQSATARINRRGRSTTVNAGDESRLLELWDDIEMDMINLTALEQAHYVEATKLRKHLLEKIADARNGTISPHKQITLRRGGCLESERVLRNEDPEAIIRTKRKRLKNILSIFSSLSDSMTKKETSYNETACVINPLVLNATNPLHVRGSPTKSPLTKKIRSDENTNAKNKPHIRKMLFEDTDLMAEDSMRDGIAHPDIKEDESVILIKHCRSVPSVTKNNNDHTKQTEAAKCSIVDVEVSAGGVDVVLDVPVIDTKKIDPIDEKLGLRPEDKTLLAQLLLRAPREERPKLRVLLSEQLSAVFNGVSPSSLQEMMTNEKTGRPQRKETRGRTRTISDSCFIEILEKLANLDVDCSLGALNVVIEEARKKTALEQGKGIPDEEIPRTTLQMYQEMVMVNCDATSKSQWNSQARFEACDSIRNYFTWACLLSVAFLKGKAEQGVSDEEAEKSPVHPMLKINMDPSIMEFNMNPGTALSTQLKHKTANRPHTQQDSGTKGGVSLTQSYKLLPLVAVAGIWGALVILVKLKNKHFSEFTDKRWNGLDIASIPLDDGSRTGLMTATSNYSCDHVVFYNSDTVSQKDVYKFHHEQFTKPFIVEQRKNLAKILGLEWEPGMPVPAELRTVMMHDGESQIIDILMEAYEELDFDALQNILASEKTTHIKNSMSCTKNQQLLDDSSSFRSSKSSNRKELTKVQQDHYRQLGNNLFGIIDTTEEPEGAPSRVHFDEGEALEKTTIYRCFMGGVKDVGIKFEKAPMFGRHISSLDNFLPKSYTGKAIRDAGIRCGMEPLDPRRVFETAGQWPHLTLEGQHAVLGAYPAGVNLMHANGFISEAEMTDMGIPWGRHEKKINRTDLVMSRWRACDLSSPKVIAIREQKKKEKAAEEVAKAQRRIEKAANKLAAQQAAEERAAKKAVDDAEKLKKGGKIWAEFCRAGFLTHRNASIVDKQFTKNPDLINVLKFLEYDGSTEAQPPLTKRPTLLKILKEYKIPQKFISQSVG